MTRRDQQQRDAERAQAEFSALSTLRKRYRLRSVRGDVYDALCPAHDDRSPSLRIYRFEGKLYFHCYAGCSFNAVRAALGLPEFKSRGVLSTFRPQEKAWSPPPGSKRYDYANLAEFFRRDAAGLRDLALTLGVSAESLADAGVGFCDRFPMYVARRNEDVPVSAWTFPMVDEQLNVCGIRMRTPGTSAAKFSFTGSRPGVFAGRRWTGAGPVGVCEGPTDRAALFDWGFDVVGKPSCNDGDAIVEALVGQFNKLAGNKRDVVIFAQSDSRKERKDAAGNVVGYFYPGQEGAAALADRLFWVARSVKVVTPPPGFKDWRQFYKNGGGRRAVDYLIRTRKPHPRPV